MRNLFITAAFLLGCLPLLKAQPLTETQIDSLAARSLRTFHVPGMAVCVVKDGKVVHAKGYGVRSLATKEKVDENTLFGIASNTKAFTATALGILIDEGKLNWDDKVRDYIPEFKLYSPYVTEEFTIRDLLTHRSGLGLGAGDLMFFPDSSDFTVKDVIYNLRFLKATSSFRTKFDYDNNLYIVAGEVIARVSGKSWDEFIEERILAPLQMSHSAGSYMRIKDKSNVIDAHASVNSVVQVIARSTSKVDHAAGSIYSSIADLSKWVILHLNNGHYGDKLEHTLISKTNHDELWTPQTILRVGNPGWYNRHFSAYGLGFFLDDIKGYKQVSHTGGIEGMVTQITMLPELNLGIIVLTNQQEDAAFVALTNQIKDAYLNLHDRNWLQILSKFMDSTRTAAKQAVDSIWNEIALVQKNNGRRELTKYSGIFRDPWMGEIAITATGGKLFFNSKRSPKLSGEMLPYKENSFVVKWRDRSMDADAFVIFSLDADGKPQGITMRPISPMTDFSYDFQDLDFKRTQ